MIHNATFLADPENYCAPAPAGLGKLLVPVERSQLGMKMEAPKTGTGVAYRRVPSKLRVSYCRIIDEIDVSINYFPFRLAQNGHAVAAEVVDYPPDPRDGGEFTKKTDNWFPCFYLPWCAGQNYRMTLKQPTTLLAPVRFFITSAVNGCSVFVEGTPEQPTVYHLNRAGGGAPPIGGNLLTNSTYWQPKKASMESAFLAAKSPKSVTAPRPLGAPALPAPTAVHAMDYMDVTAAQQPARTSADTYEAMRQAPNAKTLVYKGSHYLPFGTVFGWMQNTAWRFFFQKRACHAFEYEATDAKGAKSSVWVTRQFAWHLEEFWPNAASPGMALAKGIVP